MNALRRIRRALAFVIGIVATLWCAPALPQISPAAGAMREILVMVRHPADHYRPSGSYGGGYGDDVARSSRERLARGIARQYGLKFVEGWPMPMIGVDCFVMVVPSDRSTADVAAEVSHNSKVAWAEPVQTYRTQGGESATPNDPLYVAQPAARQWRLADLHQIATGRGMRVAVIDSGIQADHPDLAGQLIVNRNFVAGQSEVAEDHGTGVAGIIAAKPDNRLGIVGVAPGARLLGLRACWQERGAGAQTACDGLSLAKALYFATEQKADVINLSLTGPDERLLRELIKTALARGSVVVSAFDRSKSDGGFPASVPGVVAVSDLSLAGSRGQVYSAPGRDVPTTEPGGRWFLVNGSSFAAAHVSGLAALVRQRKPSAALSLVSDRAQGGAIDACATLERAAGHCDCACARSGFAGARFAH